MRQVGYALLTRAPVAIIDKKTCLHAAPRLACVKPVASVHPEPGSNSTSYYLFFLFSLRVASSSNGGTEARRGQAFLWPDGPEPTRRYNRHKRRTAHCFLLLSSFQRSLPLSPNRLAARKRVQKYGLHT